MESDSEPHLTKGQRTTIDRWSVIAICLAFVPLTLLAWWLDYSFLSQLEVTPTIWLPSFALIMIWVISVMVWRSQHLETNFERDFQKLMDVAWPPLAVAMVGTMVMMKLDPFQILGYSRHFPFLWLSCYGVTLLNVAQVTKVPVRSLGWSFFLTGIGYSLVGLTYRRLWEYPADVLLLSLTGIHLCYVAWLVLKGREA